MIICNCISAFNNADNAMIENLLRKKFQVMKPLLNERSLRRLAAIEAKTIGRRGILVVSKASGLNRNTISRGIRELENKDELDSNSIRQFGAGRKKIVDMDMSLKKDLSKLIEPYTKGDPETPLLWTTKSLRNLEYELRKQGHCISHTVLAEMLHQMKYSLQSNSKIKEGKSHGTAHRQKRRGCYMTKHYSMTNRY